MQIVCYPTMDGKRSNWNYSGGRQNNNSQLADQKVPYIPQPDYTPLPTRRQPQPAPRQIQQQQQKKLNTVDELETTRNTGGGYPLRPTANISTVGAGTAEGIAVDRVWHHPQWNSSQFPAHDWNAALMKRLSLEAQNRREENIRRQANTELERFESEIDLYLEEEEDEDEDEQVIIGTSVQVTDEKRGSSSSGGGTKKQSTSSGTSTPSSTSTLTGSQPLPASPLSISPRAHGQQPSSHQQQQHQDQQQQRPGGSGRTVVDGQSTANRSRDRDQISLESGYMYSYPGDAQRHHTGATF